MSRPFSYLVLFGVLLFIFPAAFSQDRIFTYTYQSQVLAPHEVELEVWNTLRWGRAGFYRALDQRMEFEIGLARNIQTAFYLNHLSVSTAANAPESMASGSYLESRSEMSFSNEWKLKLMDPVADPVGLALYAEYSIAPSEIELEPRLILDKLVGRTLLALNVAAEFGSEQEIEPDGTERLERETRIDINLAAGVRVGEGVHLGVEFFSRSEIEEGNLSYSSLFAGPTLSFAADRFWGNATFLPQVAALKGATDGSLALEDAERYQTRLMFSYAF